ncbi:MAG: YdcF family protein [Terriglobales bacterium]
MDTLFWHKLLTILVSPLAVVTLLLLVGLWRPRKWPIVAALAVLWAFSMPFVADALLWSLESRYPPVDNQRCVQADAVIVLGGILRNPASTTAPFEWTDCANRFEKGVDLFLAGKARYLVFSAAKFTVSPAVPSEGELLRQVALRRGVPDASILLTARVINTAAEAQAVRQLAREHRWRRILLVTSAYHMPRAMLLFSRSGIEVLPVPADFHVVGVQSLSEPSLVRFLPQGDGLRWSDTAFREYLGLCFYWLRGLFVRD